MTYSPAKCWIIFGLAAAWLLSAADIDLASLPKGPKGPIFHDMVLARPAEIGTVTSGELIIRPERVAALPESTNFGYGDLLPRLATFLQNDPRGQRLWFKLTEKAAGAVNAWRFPATARKRHIYSIIALRDYALVYALTGNPALGRFIKDYLLHAQTLPMEFWLHSELRGYDREKPQGMLETAYLATALSSVLQLTEKELFTPEELDSVRRNFRRQVHQPLRNWLETHPAAVFNFVAVIGTGYLMSARYFSERDNVDYAKKRISNYLRDAIEADGSYGEGSGYLYYPVSQIAGAFRVLPPAERKALYAAGALNKSSSWLGALYLYITDSDGRLQPAAIAFGDNSYNGGFAVGLSMILGYCFDDPLAVYFAEKFHGPHWRQGDTLNTVLLELSMRDKTSWPEARSPGELNLPLVAAFDNGESIIRKSWSPGAPVMAMKRQLETRTGYAHSRPEGNSIALGAYGEFMVVTAGSSSYRNPIYKKYDTSTRGANTVMLNGRDQLRGRQRPGSKLLLVKSFDDFDVMAQDSAASYRRGVKRAVRAVVFLKQAEIFVVLDRFEMKNRQLAEWRNHFFNRDQAANLQKLTERDWLLTRPRADLALFVDSDAETASQVTPGYMHSAPRAYSPGGPTEGRPGSAIELTVSNREKTDAITFYAVYQPLRKGSRPLPVRREGNTVTVGSTAVTLESGQLRVNDQSIRLY